MNKPITKAQLAKRAKLVKSLEDAGKPIVKRIDYIITTIFKVCKIKKVQWWLYQDEDTPDPVDFIIKCLKNYSTFSVQWDCFREVPCFYDKDGEMSDICDEGIPSRWLTEDFEDELIEGRKKYMESVKAEKKAEADKKQILRKAMKKLTSKEKAALGLVNK